MLIEFQNNTTISNSAIVSIRLSEAVWSVKLSNGYQVDLAEGEVEWLMTVDGNLIKVSDDLVLSMSSIVMFEPNEDGYMIGWMGEPPLQITQEKGELLKDFLSEREQHIVLADRIQYLQGNGVTVKFNFL